MEQAFGIPYRIVAEDSELTYVYPGRCRLIGLFCASVGLTGLPVDPPPEPTTPPPGSNPPVVDSITPTAGGDGIAVVIAGSGFGEPGPNCLVQIGTANQPISTWTDTEITFPATQGSGVMNAPLAVNLTREDGQHVNAGAFTFQDAGTIDSLAGRSAQYDRNKHKAKAGKKADVKLPKLRRNLITGADVPGLTAVEGFPVFESGAGIMLRDADGTILVGPVELTPGFMPFNVECPDGVDVVPSGNFDLTLLLAHAL